MDARNQLMDLYQEWRTLSETEGKAIRAATWSRVDACQDAKHGLQPRMLSAVELCQAELKAAGINPQDFDLQLRKIVAELILLEERNSQWLAEQREAALAQARQLDRTSRSLRQVRQAYVGDAAAAWHSYS